jgi:hypothetical protein
MIWDNEVFILQKIVDDPRYEGFGIQPSLPSMLGRESLDDDLTPGFDAEDNPQWLQPSLTKYWKPPKVSGRVTEFNDYPCLDMLLPVFSERAVNVLGDLLTTNGELLPLDSKTETKYFFYNILTISDALDQSKSKCRFWCDPPTTAIDIEHFEFEKDKISELTIFRIKELPVSVFVTSRFVNIVDSNELNGFSFKKVWPFPEKTNWRLKTCKTDAERRELKKQTLVLVLPFDGNFVQRGQIEEFEQSIDATLIAKSKNAFYYGAYEGHDTNVGKYRMFFSTPDAKMLSAIVLELVKEYRWPSDVIIHLKRGGLFDTEEVDETIVIEF